MTGGTEGRTDAVCGTLGSPGESVVSQGEAVRMGWVTSQTGHLDVMGWAVRPLEESEQEKWVDVKTTEAKPWLWGLCCGHWLPGVWEKSVGPAQRQVRESCRRISVLSWGLALPGQCAAAFLAYARTRGHQWRRVPLLSG